MTSHFPNAMTQHRTFDIAIAALIALLTAVIYGQTVGHNYILMWDDGKYVVGNSHVHALSWENAKWAWMSVGHGSVWSPLLWISFQIDAAMGLGAGGMHIENAVLHGLAGILMYILVLRLSGQRWTAAVAAMLWLVHPLCVESVAWVSERKNCLSQVLFFAALLAYDRYCRRPGLCILALVTVTSAAAMLVKPSAVVLPPLMIVMGYLLHQRRDYLRLILEQVPLLLVAVATGLLAIKAETVGGSLQQPGTVALALQGLATYLWQTVWPAELYFMYSEPANLGLSLAGGAALLAMLCAAWTLRRSKPLVSFCLIWFLASWLLVCGTSRHEPAVTGEDRQAPAIAGGSR